MKKVIACTAGIIFVLNVVVHINETKILFNQDKNTRRILIRGTDEGPIISHNTEYLRNKRFSKPANVVDASFSSEEFTFPSFFSKKLGFRDFREEHHVPSSFEADKDLQEEHRDPIVQDKHRIPFEQYISSFSNNRLAEEKNLEIRLPDVQEDHNDFNDKQEHRDPVFQRNHHEEVLHPSVQEDNHDFNAQQEHRVPVFQEEHRIPAEHYVPSPFKNKLAEQNIREVRLPGVHEENNDFNVQQEHHIPISEEEHHVPFIQEERVPNVQEQQHGRPSFSNELEKDTQEYLQEYHRVPIDHEEHHVPSIQKQQHDIPSFSDGLGKDAQEYLKEEYRVPTGLEEHHVPVSIRNEGAEKGVREYLQEHQAPFVQEERHVPSSVSNDLAPNQVQEDIYANFVQEEHQIPKPEERNRDSYVQEERQAPLLEERNRDPYVQEERQVPLFEERNRDPYVQEERQVPLLEERNRDPYVQEGRQVPLIEERNRDSYVQEERQVPLLEERNRDPYVQAERQVPLLEERNIDQPVQGERQVPLFEERNRDPYVQEERQVPLFEERSRDPYVQEERQVPLLEERNRDPYVQEERQVPLVEERNRDPYVQEERQVPLVEERNRDPYVQEERQVPLFEERIIDPSVREERQIPFVEEVNSVQSIGEEQHRESFIQEKLHFNAFNVWNRTLTPFPCVPESSPDTQGIFYIKVPKASSSTLAHVTSRFSAKEARRQGFEEGKFCKTHDPMVHNSAYELNCIKREKTKSFLWTVIRHPNDRAISHYGMKISFGQRDDSDVQFVNDLRGGGAFRSDTQLKMLNLFSNKDVPSDQLIGTIQNILQEYNFIGIYERLHESLVVLSMLSGMHVNDVLYYYKPLKNARCGKLEKPSWVTQGKEDFLASEEWNEKNKGDFMLYDAINKQLDMTIDMLGRENVKKVLNQYTHLMNIGTKLSSDLRQKLGCGILFPTPYSDIDDLENFNSLKKMTKKFVLGTKEQIEN